jgi:hypothetical protein
MSQRKKVVKYACAQWQTAASLLLPMHQRDHRLPDGMGIVLSGLLPEPERPVDELRAAVERLGCLLPIQLAEQGADGALLGAVGSPLPALPPEGLAPGWRQARGGGFACPQVVGHYHTPFLS